MSGFVAAFGPGPGLPDLVKVMSGEIAHRGTAHQIHEAAGVAGATHTHARGIYRALASTSRDRTIFFDGMLFDEPDVLARHQTDDLAEAIWRGFRQDGPAWFATLDGSFAIVIHDPGTARFTVVRDRFGARPLLVGFAGDRVLFGSELKALVADPALSRRVNRPVLAEAFRIGLVPGPATLLADVYKALPGHVGEIDAGGFHAGRSFVETSSEIDEDRSLGEVEDFLEASLIRTITAHAARGSRLGVQLSSGVDGALMAGYLSRIAPDRAHGVSFGASNWSDEESGVAADVANRLGIPFTRALVDEHFDAFAALEDAVWHVEEPTRFANAVSLEVAQAAIADRVDVVLTGEGAGVYLGTTLQPRARLLTRMWRIPAVLRKGLSRIAALVPSGAFDRLARHLPGDSFTDFYDAYFQWAPGLADPTMPSPTYERVRSLEQSLAHLSPVARCTQLESEAYQFLWVERMEQTGAAHGLDVAHPFLRKEIAEYSLSTPDRLKVTPGSRVTKPAVRNLTARFLGPEYVGLPKKQLSAPMSLWLETSPALRRAVAGLRAADSPWRAHVDPAVVEPLLDEFDRSGAADRSTARGIHMLLSVEIWLRRFLEAAPPAGGVPPGNGAGR